MKAARWAVLVGALAVLAYSALIPHGILPGESWHPFPVHMDEYIHWGDAKATAEQGTPQFTDPFSNTPAASKTIIRERGFHTYFAAFEEVSHVDWRDLVTFAPTVVAVFLGLAIFVAAQRWDAGPISILLAASIPTTLRFLGIGFFVPIAFALPLLVLAIDALGRTREGGLVPYVVILMTLWTIHPMAAATLIVFTLAFTGIMNRRADRALVVATVLALAIFAAAWPIYSRYIEAGIPPAVLPASLEEFQAALPVLLAGGLGVAFLGTIGDARDRALAFALAASALLLESVLVFRNASGRDAFFLYDRSFLIAHLFAAILSAIGIARLWSLARRTTGAPASRVWTSLALVVMLVTPTAIVANSWSRQEGAPRYEMLSNARFASYTAAADRLDRRAPRAIVDGIPTMAWTDVTGVPTLFVWAPDGATMPPAHDRFFATGSADTAFLVANRVTLVVTDRSVNNTDLTPLAPGVYQLRSDLLDQVATSAG